MGTALKGVRLAGFGLYAAVPLEQVDTCLLQLVSGVEGAFKSWLGRQSEGEVSMCNHNISWYSMQVCTVSGWGVCVYVEGNQESD